MNKPEPRYTNETMLLADNEVDPNVQVNLSTRKNNDESETYSEKGAKDANRIRETDLEDGAVPKNLSEENNILTSSLEENDEEGKGENEKELTGGNNDTPNDLQSENTFDNTREFSAENKKNQTIMLAVSNVQILSKSNPDALNTRSTGGKGNPLGEQTTSTSNNFSVSDIPSYPGGDRALNNYFKGKLRPIQIPQHQDKFDRTVLIELTINSRGKLKDYKIRGQLHPTHQDALVKAIEELPRFNKGSEKITYSLGLTF